MLQSARRLAALLLVAQLATAEEERSWTHKEFPSLPIAVSNNAVVAVATDDSEYLVSFSGLGEGRTHADTHDRAFVLRRGDARWQEVARVPGERGRLASVAVAVGGHAYVFGGYTVARDGTEVSTPWSHRFDPATGRYERLANMPVPVDDAVAVSYRDRYIYLISGWHDLGNVNLVQRFDTQTNRWDQATPTPGPAVFGHAGGIAGSFIVYCDGVAVETFEDRRREFSAVSNCYQGAIDSADPRRIDWRRLPAHPGLPRYRMAAASADDGVRFVGGSENPYNYDGIGYNGEPSEPVTGGFMFDVEAQGWRLIGLDGPATMDHRGLPGFAGRWLIVGGMLAGQQVSNRVFAYDE